MIISAKKVTAYFLFICSLAILFILGWWQLTRGLEKASIESLSTEGMDRQPLKIDRDMDWQPVAYRNSTLQGRWVTDKTLLLENRILKGQPGYEVLVPFALAADEQWILVNRGWIHQESIRQGEVNANLLNAVLSEAPDGQLYLPEAGFTLGESLIKPLTNPVRFLYYDFSALSEAVQHRMAPAVLVLDQNHSASFERIWKPGTITAERHYAYTAQWWGLALTLFIFGLIWRRRIHNPASND